MASQACAGLFCSLPRTILGLPIAWRLLLQWLLRMASRLQLLQSVAMAIPASLALRPGARVSFFSSPCLSVPVSLCRCVCLFLFVQLGPGGTGSSKDLKYVEAQDAPSPHWNGSGLPSTTRLSRATKNHSICCVAALGAPTLFTKGHLAGQLQGVEIIGQN